jgi:protocatechuate 3,4-dioxygenase beta subunit
MLRGLGGLGAVVLAGCSGGTRTAPRDGRLAKPTPAVDDGDGDVFPTPAVCAATADNIEGPYFLPGAPHRATLVGPKDAGERLSLGGVLRGVDCQPLAGEIEIWQADANGDYDMAGFRFRAALAIDAGGAWHVDTVVPGRYFNVKRYRPAHIHAKVRAPGYRELTTQLYFEGDPYNDGDPFIDTSLVMPTRVVEGVRHARFDFVLAA